MPQPAAVKEQEENGPRRAIRAFAGSSLRRFLMETPRVGFWLDNTSLSPHRPQTRYFRRCAGVNG